MDVCRCGHYRDKHGGEKQTGRCLQCMVAAHDPLSAGLCKRFRFARHDYHAYRPSYPVIVVDFVARRRAK